MIHDSRHPAPPATDSSPTTYERRDIRDLSGMMEEHDDPTGTGQHATNTGRGGDIGQRDMRFAPIADSSGPTDGLPITLTHNGNPTRF